MRFPSASSSGATGKLARNNRAFAVGMWREPQMAQGLIEALCLRKGLDPGKIAAVDFAQHKEEQYNLLAQGVRESLDMDAIYRILKEGI